MFPTLTSGGLYGSKLKQKRSDSYFEDTEEGENPSYISDDVASSDRIIEATSSSHIAANGRSYDNSIAEALSGTVAGEDDGDDASNRLESRGNEVDRISQNAHDETVFVRCVQ